MIIAFFLLYFTMLLINAFCSISLFNPFTAFICLSQVLVFLKFSIENHSNHQHPTRSYYMYTNCSHIPLGRYSWATKSWAKSIRSMKHCCINKINLFTVLKWHKYRDMCQWDKILSFFLIFFNCQIRYISPAP